MVSALLLAVPIYTVVNTCVHISAAVGNGWSDDSDSDGRLNIRRQSRITSLFWSLIALDTNWHIQPTIAAVDAESAPPDSHNDSDNDNHNHNDNDSDSTSNCNSDCDSDDDDYSSF